MNMLRPILKEEAEFILSEQFIVNSNSKILFPKSLDEAINILNRDNLESAVVPVLRSFEQDIGLFILRDIGDEKISKEWDYSAEVASLHALDSLVPLLGSKLPPNYYKLNIRLMPIKNYVIVISKDDPNIYFDRSNGNCSITYFPDKKSLINSHKASEKNGELSSALIGKGLFLHCLRNPRIEISIPRLYKNNNYELSIVNNSIHETIRALVEPLIIDCIIHKPDFNETFRDNKVLANELIIDGFSKMSELFAYSMTPYLAIDVLTEPNYIGLYLENMQLRKKRQDLMCDYGKVIDIIQNSNDFKSVFDKCIINLKQ